MRRSTALFALGFFCAVPASAIDSVILGRGLSNEFFAELECSPTDICMDSLYVWELDAKRTLAGPTITGRVRAVVSVHGLATSEFVRSVELFVLRPVEKSDADHPDLPTFSLLALSPRYPGGKYCLYIDPRSVGLEVKTSTSSDGMFCFRRADVLRPNKSLERIRAE
jgi:hypothetical protein